MVNLTDPGLLGFENRTVPFTLRGSRFSVRVQVRFFVLRFLEPEPEPEPRTLNFEPRTELEHEPRSENREA